MTPTAHEKADALVFFGATGDLAYKKIFPSLQAMGYGNQPVDEAYYRHLEPSFRALLS